MTTIAPDKTTDALATEGVPGDMEAWVRACATDRGGDGGRRATSRSRARGRFYAGGGTCGQGRTRGLILAFQRESNGRFNAPQRLATQGDASSARGVRRARLINLWFRPAETGGAAAAGTSVV